MNIASDDFRICEEKQHAVSMWAGANAMLWDYSVTHRQLTIRLERPGRPGNLHLICASCEHVHGPFWWKQAQPEVLSFEDRYLVRDKASGFQLVCRVVALAENVEPVYWSNKSVNS